MGFNIQVRVVPAPQPTAYPFTVVEKLTKSIEGIINRHPVGMAWNTFGPMTEVGVNITMPGPDGNLNAVFDIQRRIQRAVDRYAPGSKVIWTGSVE